MDDGRLFQDRDGQKALAKFRANNGCSDTSVPHAAAMCSTGGITPECADFDGCTAPLRFCSHDDPIQGNSGWPCFAYDQIYEFFESQRAP